MTGRKSKHFKVIAQSLFNHFHFQILYLTKNFKTFPMKVAILYGSTRSERQGIKAAKFIRKSVIERGHDAHLLDAAEINLPFLDKMYKEYGDNAPRNMKQTAMVLEQADGILIVSGEYNHSIPPALKNLIDHFQSEYYWKPSGIVSYSAGPFGGVRVAPHLRAIAGELGMPSISSMFAISTVQSAFDENGNAIDNAYPRRVQRFLEEFEWYMEAFKNRRDQGTPY